MVTSNIPSFRTGRAEAELAVTKEEKKRMAFEKDREIEKLQHNIYSMEKEYERILLVSTNVTL